MARLPPRLATAARALGFALLVPVGVLYLAGGLVVPQPWLIVLWGIGAALVVCAVAYRGRPLVVLATPVVGALIWFVVVTLGGVFLDWTA